MNGPHSHPADVTAVDFSANGHRLSGMLHRPAGRRPPVVIGCHGLLSDCRSPKQTALAKGCNAAGLAYFRFDHRGCGSSQGIIDPATVLEDRIEDLAAACATLKAAGGLGRVAGFFGSSMGGAVCLAAAGRFRPAAVVVCAAPVRSRTLTADGADRLDFDIAPRLSGVRGVLVFHGDADEVVPFTDARDIMRRAAAPKRLVRQRGGDHRMTRPEHQRIFQQEAVAWFATRVAAGRKQP